MYKHSFSYCNINDNWKACQAETAQLLEDKCVERLGIVTQSFNLQNLLTLCLLRTRDIANKRMRNQKPEEYELIFIDLNIAQSIRFINYQTSKGIKGLLYTSS